MRQPSRSPTEKPICLVERQHTIAPLNIIEDSDQILLVFPTYLETTSARSAWRFPPLPSAVSRNTIPEHPARPKIVAAWMTLRSVEWPGVSTRRSSLPGYGWNIRSSTEAQICFGLPTPISTATWPSIVPSTSPVPASSQSISSGSSGNAT